MPVTDEEAAAVVPANSWIRRYVIHAVKQTSAPLVYHLGVGVTLLGTTCPLAYGMSYAGTLRANNFCLLVGRSGEDQKSSALAVGKELLDDAAAPLIGDFPGSPEGLLDSLQRRPSQFIPISEFGKFLSSAQRGYFEPIKTLLADVWDCVSSDTDILTTSGWKGLGEIEIGDMAISLDPATDRLVHSRVLDVGSRPVRDGEKMVTLKGHNHDIRTTEGHRYYIKYRDPNRGYTPSAHYLVKTGKQMAARRGSFYLPFSADPTFGQPRVSLSDDELRFLAWALTDSYISRGGKQVQLFQAEHKHLNRIRALLQRLKMSYSEAVTTAAGRVQGDYTATSNIWTLNIHEESTRPYRDLLDKNLPLVLLDMDRKQFEVFWKELLLADGEQTEKGLNGLLWSARKTFIDRLQHLAVINGFSTQYGARELPSGKTAYRMSINTKHHVLSDPGNRKSIRFEVKDPEPGEVVWCVTTEHGTLVTRRNGKVVILGNCGSTQRTKANNKIIRVDNPRLSIGAACSIPYLERHTLAEDWTGGFMGRWLVLYGKRQRTDPDPVGDKSDFGWLSEELKMRATTPTAGWCTGLDDQAKILWNDWFRDVTDRHLPDNIIGIRARAPAMARKIALVYGWDFGPALAGHPWQMGVDVLEPAIRLTELHIKSLVHLSDVIAEHPDARLRRDIIQALQNLRGVATLGEIIGILKLKKRPLMEMLDSLMEEGRVTRKQTSEGVVFVLNSIKSSPAETL